MTSPPAIALSFFELIRTESLPGLGPEVRSDVRKLDPLLAEVSEFCHQNQIAGMQQNLLRAAALLWHDDLDGSHNFSQAIKTPDGSFLHGIMHRREPDSSNAKYWFRLVGDHNAFIELAESVDALNVESKAQDLISSLTPSGEWDPVAFVDACSRAMQGRRNSSTYQRLQRIQELEFKALLSQIL